MSNSPSEYIQKVETMFSRVTDQYEAIALEFVAVASEILIENTPGPDLQYELTEYIATGRLRAGWHVSTTIPPLTVQDVDGGPYDTSRGGAQTKARLRTQIFSNGIQRIVFLWNEIGYAYYVHYGLENHEHIGPRPWVYDASKLGEEMLDIAMERVGLAA